MVRQEELRVRTQGRGMEELTQQVSRVVRESGVRVGLCQVFLHHTSASLLLCENADPQVKRDLEAFFARLVKDGDPLFRHTAEGLDDMPAHVRTVLTQVDMSLPIRDGALQLGTWQGLYLWEHRTDPHQRRVTVTVIGE